MYLRHRYRPRRVVGNQYFLPAKWCCPLLTCSDSDSDSVHLQESQEQWLPTCQELAPSSRSLSDMSGHRIWLQSPLPGHRLPASQSGSIPASSNMGLGGSECHRYYGVHHRSVDGWLLALTASSRSLGARSRANRKLPMMAFTALHQSRSTSSSNTLLAQLATEQLGNGRAAAMQQKLCRFHGSQRPHRRSLAGCTDIKAWSLPFFPAAFLSQFLFSMRLVVGRIPLFLHTCARVTGQEGEGFCYMQCDEEPRPHWVSPSYWPRIVRGCEATTHHGSRSGLMCGAAGASSLLIVSHHLLYLLVFRLPAHPALAVETDRVPWEGVVGVMCSNTFLTWRTDCSSSPMITLPVERD